MTVHGPIVKTVRIGHIWNICRDNKENWENRENCQFMGHRESEYLGMCKKIKKKGLFAE